MWKWHSGVTVSTAVYAFSRYGLLIGRFLQVATIYPMSDRVCSVDITFSLYELIIALNRGMWSLHTSAYQQTPIPLLPPLHSCEANTWAQVVTQIMSITSNSYLGNLLPPIKLIASILWPASIRSVKQECMVGAYNSYSGSSTFSDNHCE